MTTTEPESSVRIACLQMEPCVGEKDRNLARGLEMIGEAAEAGADLVVLPELCSSGYVFNTREEARMLAEEIPDGPSCRAWADAAARHGMHIVAGIAEREGHALYNSAVVVSPQGVIGTYRKNHLWADENLFFEPGETWACRCFTPISGASRWWSATTSGSRKSSGWQQCKAPTSCACRHNWVPMPDQPAGLPKMSNILAMGGAHSNSMFLAAADRVGIERGQPFIGNSLIVQLHGLANCRTGQRRPARRC